MFALLMLILTVQNWSCKSSSVVYKGVAYKKNRVRS